MLKVGVTGGIGSGKSTVCAFFELLGIPVFYADESARTIMDEDAALGAAIRSEFGESVFSNGRIDRAALSAAVFGNPEKLQRLNALVHPATIAAAARWLDAQTGPYAIKEAAIFFESGSSAAMDIMVGVFAPLELRIQRAMNRSSLTREEVLTRVSRQMDEDEKMRRCDFVIINDDVQAIIPQVLDLDKKLRTLSIPKLSD